METIPGIGRKDERGKRERGVKERGVKTEYGKGINRDRKREKKMER